MNRTRHAALLALSAALLSMATASAASAKTTVSMSGSTSVAPLATQLAKAFVKVPAYRGKVAFRILQGGSDVGITDVSRGRVSIGNSSRDPKPADPSGIVFNKIAKDAVCVVTNRQNPLGNLSQNQIQDIFSGRIRSWSKVPGAGVSGTIDLVVRTPASGTQDAFQNMPKARGSREASRASGDSEGAD